MLRIWCCLRFGTLLLLLLAGCRAQVRTEASPYQTIAKDPRRDTDLAREHTKQALALLEEQKPAQAEEMLKKALAADVMYGPAHNNLGLVYYQQQRLYLAAWEFQYAIKLMPNQPEPKNNLGLVFEAAGKLDEAVSAYQEARGLEPDNPQFIGNLARARLRRGDRPEDLRDLLAELVYKDARPEWVDWAREKLHHTTAPREIQP